MNKKLMGILRTLFRAGGCYGLGSQESIKSKIAHDQIMELWKENLRGALARGYCTERNKHKILDPNLIEDMVTQAEKNMEG